MKLRSYVHKRDLGVLAKSSFVLSVINRLKTRKRVGKVGIQWDKIKRELFKEIGLKTKEDEARWTRRVFRTFKNFERIGIGQFDQPLNKNLKRRWLWNCEPRELIDLFDGKVDKIRLRQPREIKGMIFPVADQLELSPVESFEYMVGPGGFEDGAHSFILRIPRFINSDGKELILKAFEEAYLRQDLPFSYVPVASPEASTLAYQAIQEMLEKDRSRFESLLQTIENPENRERIKHLFDLLASNSKKAS